MKFLDVSIKAVQYIVIVPKPQGQMLGTLFQNPLGVLVVLVLKLLKLISNTKSLTPYQSQDIINSIQKTVENA